MPSDIRDTGRVLAGAAETLDLSRPVAVMALMVLQYIPDGDDPWGIVGHVLESLPPGSYLTVSDTVRDIDTGRVTEGTARLNQRVGAGRDPPGDSSWPALRPHADPICTGAIPFVQSVGGAQKGILCRVGYLWRIRCGVQPSGNVTLGRDRFESGL